MPKKSKRPPRRHYFAYSLGGVATLIALILLVGLWKLYGPVPSYTGEYKLAGLNDKVRIYRDNYGVPHIFAADMNDAIHALGYLHASERLFQMEMQRRAGQGRLAEVAGPDMVGIDKFIRTLDLYHLSEQSFAVSSPAAQKWFQAYADGVNDWINSHPHSLPPEFTLLGFSPEPWKPADSLVWGKLMSLQLSHNYKLELLRASAASKLSAPQMQTLFNPLVNGGHTPVTLDPQAQVTGQNTPAIINADSIKADALGMLLGLDHAASNEWVISGARTATGKPILANDPHLGLGAPILWYLARIVTPHLSVKGATVPGLPVILLGQNDAIAWGLTTTGSDVQDLFIETIDPKDPHRYLAPKNTSLPFVERQEVIHVKGADDIVLNVRSTRHGPVLSDIDSDMAALIDKDKVMALAFTGLDAHDRTAEALTLVDQSKTWDDLMNALRLYQGPPQNMVFADSKGDIGFINPGLVPVRKKGDGTMPVDGASGAYDWTGMLTFDQWPKLYNPATGYIFNANNQVAPEQKGRYLGKDWEEPWRAMRIQQLLNVPEPQTLDSSAAMQADHLSLVARQLLPYLIKHDPEDDAQAHEALAYLRTWNGVMDRDKAAPLIFEAWLLHMHQLLLVDKVGHELAEKGPFAASAISAILAGDDTKLKGGSWCDTPGCDDVVMQALHDALAELTRRQGPHMAEWRWGREHVTQLHNKVFDHVPGFKKISDLSVPSSGDFYTLDRGGGFDNGADMPFARTHGGGYRAIYDLADPSRSRFMITTGQSGLVMSRHYGDLVHMWNAVKSITISGSEQDLQARKLPLLVLEPQE